MYTARGRFSARAAVHIRTYEANNPLVVYYQSPCILGLGQLMRTHYFSARFLEFVFVQYLIFNFNFFAHRSKQVFYDTTPWDLC